MSKEVTLADLCLSLGKSRAYVRNLQRELSLYVPKDKPGYTAAYVGFMKTLVALRTLSVPVSTLRDLLEKEKKILRLLHFDSMDETPTWYMGARPNGQHTGNHLLLTGHDLGFPTTSDTIQSCLNFRETEAELFAGAEMGEDVRRVLKVYTRLLKKVGAKVRSEKRVLESALTWADEAFLATPDRH